jgi:thymidylate synthase (FAD)
VVGIAYTEGHGAYTVDHAWNEVSLRYVDASDFDFYTPQGGFRTQSESNKQASTDELIQNDVLMKAYTDHAQGTFALYKELVDAGVAKEQARGVLPLNIYTEFYWTISLQALTNFIHLRTHAGAQYEIREYADALEQLTQLVVPVSYKYLLEG